MLHPFVARIQPKRVYLTRLALLCALLIVPCVSHAQTVEIHIRIVNGKNGRPIKNETLRVWTTRNHVDADLWPTDATGSVLLKVDGNAQIALDEKSECKLPHPPRKPAVLPAPLLRRRNPQQGNLRGKHLRNHPRHSQARRTDPLRASIHLDGKGQRRDSKLTANHVPPRSPCSTPS